MCFVSHANRCAYNTYKIQLLLRFLYGAWRYVAYRWVSCTTFARLPKWKSHSCSNRQIIVCIYIYIYIYIYSICSICYKRLLQSFILTGSSLMFTINLYARKYDYHLTNSWQCLQRRCYSSVILWLPIWLSRTVHVGTYPHNLIQYQFHRYTKTEHQSWFNMECINFN